VTIRPSDQPIAALVREPDAALGHVATINDLAAAAFLVHVMLISGDRRLMGAQRNGRLASILGWVTWPSSPRPPLVLPSVA
jgi:Mn2+/Fe2+ NRAMP family transporter